MQRPRFFRMLLATALTACALAACDTGPKTVDDCLLRASRESQSDRQFRNMAEACKQQFRKP